MSTQGAIYQKAHRNVQQQRGHASEHQCRGFLEPCGRYADEWAHIDRSGESFSLIITETKDGRTYTTERRTSMNPLDFEAMCRRHHKLHDNHLRQVLAEVAA